MYSHRGNQHIKMHLLLFVAVVGTGSGRGNKKEAVLVSCCS